MLRTRARGADEAAAELRAGGTTVLAVPHRRSRPEQVQKLCDGIVAESAASTVQRGRGGAGLAEHTLADWEWVPA